MVKKIIETAKPVVVEYFETYWTRLGTGLTSAIGLVIGWSWRDAIRDYLDIRYPELSGFIGAIIITIVFSAVLLMMAKIGLKKRKKKKGDEDE